MRDLANEFLLANYDSALNAIKNVIKDYKVENIEICKPTKWLPLVSLAVAAEESNWGRSELAIALKNFHGIKATVRGEKVVNQTIMRFQDKLGSWEEFAWRALCSPQIKYARNLVVVLIQSVYPSWMDVGSAFIYSISFAYAKDWKDWMFEVDGNFREMFRQHYSKSSKKEQVDEKMMNIEQLKHYKAALSKLKNDVVDLTKYVDNVFQHARNIAEKVQQIKEMLIFTKESFLETSKKWDAAVHDKVEKGKDTIHKQKIEKGKDFVHKQDRIDNQIKALRIASELFVRDFDNLLARNSRHNYLCAVSQKLREMARANRNSPFYWAVVEIDDCFRSSKPSEMTKKMAIVLVESVEKLYQDMLEKETNEISIRLHDVGFNSYSLR